jgi:AI-2 transport protein TqsA
VLERGGLRPSPALTLLAIVAVAASLRVASAVFVPIALALFLLAITWPLLTRLERWMPRWAALTIVVLVVLLVVAALGSVVSLAFARVAERGPQLAERVRELTHAVDAWSRSAGLPAIGTAGSARLTATLASAAEYLRAGVGLLVLVLAFFALAMAEVRDFETRLTHHLRGRQRAEVVDTVREIASRVRRHMVALTITSALSGLITGFFTLAVGLELAPLWALLTFLLNYIAILGPFIAIIPPTLYAALQFDGLAQPVIVAAGVGIIQAVMGNLVDPKIEGRVLALSPVVVLLALVFWGWLWGVTGAFLSIPITAAIIIACESFPQTQWIATLATDLSRANRATHSGAVSEA